MRYIILALLPTYLFAQNPINIPKVETPIELDGQVTTNEWQHAYILYDFKQIEPNLGLPATESATIRVLYDDTYLYISGVCTYLDPSQLFATTLERDAVQLKDDYIQIHLDTYNDKINTLVFRTNPLGARQDMEVSRNGEEFNTSWNTFWTVRSTILDNGWSTEIRIPFSSLRYKMASENIMGIKAAVKYKLKNELMVAPLNAPDIPAALYHFTNSEEIRFQNLPAAKPLYITPYVKANYISENTLNEAQTTYTNSTLFLEEKKFSDNRTLDKILSNVGLDVKYKPNASHTIDFTLNTDFAQAEADDRIINISRFPIFLPEKRLFFLENADLFNANQFDHRLFNSRRIGIQDGAAVPIVAGLRFTGGNSGLQYGMLSMQTHEVEDLVGSTNHSVIRLKKNVGNLGSYIGLINTNRIGDELNNHLLAVDANIRITNTIRTQFTAGVTFDQEMGDWKPMYGASLNTFKNNGFGINYRFREYTEDFNPRLGFVEQPNTKRLVLNHGWRKAYSNHSFLQFLSMGHYFTKNWLSNTGQPGLFQTNIYLTAIHKKGGRLTMFFPIYQEDNLYSDWEIADGITIPSDRYVMWKFNPIFVTGNAKPYQIRLDTEFGEFYGGNQFTLSYNVSYDVSKNFKAELGGAYNQLRFPERYTQNVSRKVNLSRYFSRLKFNFSAKATLNSYLQYDTRADKMTWNLRFRYNPIEGTDLFVVYNHNANVDRDQLSPRPPFTSSQLFIVKFSKTIIK